MPAGTALPARGRAGQGKVRQQFFFEKRTKNHSLLVRGTPPAIHNLRLKLIDRLDVLLYQDIIS
jgi:hypothetical protein